jgi:kumamolisin
LIRRAIERHDRDILAGARQIGRIVVESRHLRRKEGARPGIRGPGARGLTVSVARRGLRPGNPHGGYNLAALNTYFEQVLGGTTPQITNVVVSGPGNDPGPDTPASDQQGDSTGEVMLDACVVGSVAPGAHIFMYFTEFTTQGWVDALQEAIAGDNDIAVISISYGNPEDDPQGAWTAASVQTVNSAFQAAIAAGITICCASGDDGSSDGVASGAHVDFPASSPYVLAVGGTKLTASRPEVRPFATSVRVTSI